jgi:biopolymer transport protein ExbD
VDEDKLIEVEPRNDGFRYRGMLMGRDSMVDELKKLHKNDPERVLIIVMARDVKYERLVDTLSVARETGIGRVSLKNAGGGSL